MNVLKGEDFMRNAAVKGHENSEIFQKNFGYKRSGESKTYNKKGVFDGSLPKRSKDSVNKNAIKNGAEFLKQENNRNYASNTLAQQTTVEMSAFSTPSVHSEETNTNIIDVSTEDGDESYTYTFTFTDEMGEEVTVKYSGNVKYCGESGGLSEFILDPISVTASRSEQIINSVIQSFLVTFISSLGSMYQLTSANGYSNPALITPILSFSLGVVGASNAGLEKVIDIFVYDKLLDMGSNAASELGKYAVERVEEMQNTINEQFSKIFDTEIDKDFWSSYLKDNASCLDAGLYAGITGALDEKGVDYGNDNDAGSGGYGEDDWFDGDIGGTGGAGIGGAGIGAGIGVGGGSAGGSGIGGAGAGIGWGSNWSNMG